MNTSDRIDENRQSLWLVIIGPIVWAAHFLLCYLTAAIWCAKRGAEASLFPVRVAIGIYTAVALVAIALNAWAGYRRHRYGADARLPHDFDSAEDRHRFLGFATLLLAILSGIATLYAAMVAMFFWNCQ